MYQSVAMVIAISAPEMFLGAVTVFGATRGHCPRPIQVLETADAFLIND